MKACPYCAETIQDAAVKCRYCGEWLDPNKRPAWSAEAGSEGTPSRTATLTPGSVEAGAKKAAAGARQGGEVVVAPAAASAQSVAPALGVPMPNLAPARWTPPAGFAQDLEAHAAAAPASGERAQREAEAASARERSLTAVGMPSLGTAAATSASAAAPASAPASAPTPALTRAVGKVAEALESERMSEKMERLKDAARKVREDIARGPVIATTPAPGFVAPRVDVVEPRPAPRVEAIEPLAAPARAHAPEGRVESGGEERTRRVPAVRVPEPGVPAPRSSAIAAELPMRPPAAEDRATRAEPRASSRFDALPDDDEERDERDEHDDRDEHDEHARPRSPTSSFEGGFLGSIDEAGDGDDELGSEFAGAVATRRPLPLLPIGLGLVVVTGIALFLFRAELFGAGAKADEKIGDASVAQSEDAGSEAAGDEAAADRAPSGDDLAGPRDPAQGPPGEPPGTGETPPPTGAPPGETPPSGTPPAGTPPGGTPPTTPPVATPPAGTPPVATPPATPASGDTGTFGGALAAARDAYKKRKLDDAKTKIESALALAPNHPDALVLKAQIQLEQADQAGALATATTCVGIDVTKADCWLTIAVLQQNAKNLQPAIDAWERYLEHAPPDARYVASAKSELKRLRKKLG